MGDNAVTVSSEVEELVQRMMLIGEYPSEDAVLVAALHALEQRRFADKDQGAPSVPQISPLGARLREIRKQYLDGGGALLTAEELDREIAERRGHRSPGD